MTDEDYIAHALSNSDLDRAALLADIDLLEKSAGCLTISEYVDFGLYNWHEFSLDDRRAFISNRLHWQLVAKVCDPAWNAATEDKWLMESILRRAGVPTPPNLAVLDTRNRVYPGARKIQTGADLKAFLSENAGRPFFGKKLNGMASDGVFLCASSDAGEVTLFHEGTMSSAVLFERLRSDTYVFQPVIRNHSFFDPIAVNLCTVRLAVAVYDEAIKPLFAIMKIAQGSNLTDVFKRAGNVALGIDIPTGKITSARCRLPIGTVRLDETTSIGKALLGQQLPFWKEVLKVAGVVSHVFTPVRYQSMDIAITEQGPVVIEVNTGGGFGSPQLTYGKGLLKSEFKNFIRAAGIELGTL